MQFNSIVFPAPKSSYKEKDYKNLIYIPKTCINSQKCNSKQFSEGKVTASIIERIDKENFSEEISQDLKIPCLMFEYPEGSDYIILYWHANAEDLGMSSKFACKLKDELKMHVMVIEYPGYGVYKGKPSSHGILLDSEIILDYVVKRMEIPHEKIILLGRSLGSAPATHLAQKKCKALILISPFSSVKAVAKNIIGIFGNLIADGLRNVDKISNVKSPILFIHGKNDTLIPYIQSIELQAKCTNKSFIFLSETMSHNTFRFQEDIVNPIKNFMEKLEIEVKHSYDLIPKLNEDLLNSCIN